LPAFIRKLAEKKQNNHQQKQAYHAIDLFYDFLKSNSQIKVLLSPNISSRHPKRLSEEAFAGYGSEWADIFSDLENEIKLRYYSPKTLSSYSKWLRQFQYFTRNKDPKSLSTPDVKEFLTQLAVKKRVSASTQNQAFNAILFVFRHILKKDFGDVKISSGLKRDPIFRLYYHGKRLMRLSIALPRLMIWL
jgi:site-specific recombinase XerD